MRYTIHNKNRDEESSPFISSLSNSLNGNSRIFLLRSDPILGNSGDMIKIGVFSTTRQIVYRFIFHLS